MANFKNDILEAVDGEQIEAIVIGDYAGWANEYEELPVVSRDKSRYHIPISWEEAAPMLDYDYDDGFGGAECHPVYAWTPTRVIIVNEYDGSTRVNSVPRNPKACEPYFT